MTILPDVLASGLQVVFCGTAASMESARTRSYYAGRGNRFWLILHRTGLAPRQFAPSEYGLLPEHGIGLTDIAKHHAGGDADIPRSGWDRAGLRTRIDRYRPAILAFNGKNAAKLALDTARVDYGWQETTFDGVRLYVLPSTSAAARGSWNERYWHELAAAAINLRPRA